MLGLFDTVEEKLFFLILIIVLYLWIKSKIRRRR